MNAGYFVERYPQIVARYKSLDPVNSEWFANKPYTLTVPLNFLFQNMIEYF